MLTLPDDVLDHLSTGEWTVSIKGVPYSNLAIDEAHESVINRRLKQITSRPSTIELADFMSYLDVILVNFEAFVFQHNAEPHSHVKVYVSERAPVIKQLIMSTEVNLFEVGGVRPLSNVFLRNPPELDHSTRNDLLSFYSVGKDCFLHKVGELLCPSDHEKAAKPSRVS